MNGVRGGLASFLAYLLASTTNTERGRYVREEEEEEEGAGKHGKSLVFARDGVSERERERERKETHSYVVHVCVCMYVCVYVCMPRYYDHY